MYLWSKIATSKSNDMWEERFHGNTSAVIEEIKGGKSIRVQMYCQTKKEADELKQSFGGTISEVVAASWEEPQDLTKKPLLIRNKIVLTQTTNPEEVAQIKANYPERIVLNVPAEMAFGTGDHPTTANCLRMLCDYAQKRKKPWSMVDVGCGTGVLAMAASALGAEPVEAFDFDAKAVEVAQKNIAPNKISNVSLYQKDVFEWHPPSRFDLIIANLFSSVLQQAFPTLKKALQDKGTIIISGILHTQWEDTKAAAYNAGLDFHTMKRKGKWVTAQGEHLIS